MHLGNRLIKRGERPFIVAEIGANHLGRVDRAKELVDAAWEAGVDAVKFQHYRLDEVYAGRPPHDAVEGLGLDGLASVISHARGRGLPVVCTVFTPGRVNEIRELIDAYKVASPDAVNMLLISEITRLGMRVIVSTGGMRPPDRERLSKYFSEDNYPHALLHCVPQYPAKCADLARGHFAEGYSDHTGRWNTGALAVACGYCLLEVHVMLSDVKGPDRAVSLVPGALKRYVNAAHDAYAQMGYRSPACPPDLAARQSLVATANMKAGEKLESMGLARPGYWYGPEALWWFRGRTLAKDVFAGERISLDMVE